MGEIPGMPRRYAPPGSVLSTNNPPQRFGHPRAGYGTVYFNSSGGRGSARRWTGTWVDRYPEPDSSGAVVGVEEFEGDRVEVLAWVRSCAASTRFAFSEQAQKFVQLPDADDDIDI